MPTYLDIHRNIEGLTSEKLAEAHKMDIKTQEKYGVKFQKYWYNEENGQAFCLYEAPNKEAGQAVHREGHGMVADEIIEVKEGK